MELIPVVFGAIVVTAVAHRRGLEPALIKLYRNVLSAQRAALIHERDAGRIEEDAVRVMLERLDLQEAGVSARLESRF